MPRDIPVGNGRLLLTFDNRYQIRDVYFPHVGQENHAGAGPCRFGVYTDVPSLESVINGNAASGSLKSNMLRGKGVQIPEDHPDRKRYLSLDYRKRRVKSSDVAELTLMSGTWIVGNALDFA